MLSGFALRLSNMLNARVTYRTLIALNAVVALAILWSMRGENGGGDFRAYLGMAEGITHGSYSMWWMMDPPIPDTFRTPGYPLYIACALWLFNDWAVLKIVQAVFYALAVHLMLRLIDRHDRRLMAKNIFLLLLLPSVNIPHYIPLMLPEIPVIVCIAALLVSDPLWKRPTCIAAIGIGLLYGFIFQCRPIFLLFPFARLVCDALFARRSMAWGKNAVIMLSYIVTLMPYSVWNLRHHGVFSVTPLEGGAGVMHIGYWSGRIPNHFEKRYWGNTTGDEMVRFVPEADVPGNVAAFNREWDVIDSTLAPLLTARDSFVLLKARDKKAHLIPTFNTVYTLERERLLKAKTIAHIKEHPGYFTAYKFYSAIRLWVVGVPHDGFRAAGIAGKLAMIFSFLFTLAIFLASIILVPIAYRRRLLQWRNTYPLVLYVIYFWLIHIPFAIQTRYTIPVRMVLYVLLAMAITSLIEAREKRAGSVESRET